MQYIFIHGLGQTPSSWDKTIEGMKSDVKIECPSLSDMLLYKDISYNELFNAFSSYCNKFSEPLNLCGLSLGGVLALHYAIDYPKRVQSLLLIGTQYKMPKHLLQFQNVLFRLMPKSMFLQMGFGKKDFIRLSKSMMHLDFTSPLESISCPVLVLCGERDKANKKASLELAKGLPNSEIKIMQNAGHEVNIEKPNHLASIINEFFHET